MMEKRWIRIIIQTVRVAMVLIALLLLQAISRYRIQEGEPTLVTSEILFHGSGWARGSLIRSQFESLLGRRKLFLTDRTHVFVTDADFDRCWPEPWLIMREKNYTFEVTLRVQRLRFHEESLAEVIALDTLHKVPSTIKQAL
jgi:hypothetical protein